MRMIKASGIGRAIEGILKHIISKNENWQFILFGKKKELEEYEFAGRENTRIIECISSIYSYSEQIELYRKIPRDIDVFWSPHYNIPLFYKGKLIVTVHDLFHLAMLNGMKSLHKRIYAKLFFHFLSRRAEKIICVSEFTADELQKYTKVKSEKISVIHRGVEKRWFHIKRQKNPRPQRYILYVGNIKPHKNLLRLLKAFQSVKKKIPHDLVLVGKKDGFITGDAQVTQMAMNDERIVFTGYISDEILEQYYMHADLLVFPSLYEGFGLPPLEAMACRCPVIASNVASIPEICKRNVIYCNPYSINDIAEKILFVLMNGIEKEGIEENRKMAMQFTLEKEVGMYEGVIKKILE